MLGAGICSLLLGGAAGGLAAEVEVVTSVPQLPQVMPQVMPQAAPDASPEKARALLDQVKKSEQDREITIKQTEIERLQEDQTKTENDLKGLQETIDSTSGLIGATSEHLKTLTTEHRKLERELAVADAWINAEQLKTAGLQALTDAQGKSLSALTLRGEEAAARSHLRTVELEILKAGQQLPGEGHEDAQSDLAKARKALAVAAAKAAAEERLAHEAMKAATAKMALADAKATQAQHLAGDDLILEPPAAIVKTKAKTSAKPAEKPAPVATGPKAAADTGSPAKSAAKTGSSKTNKPSAAGSSHSWFAR